MDFTFEGVGHWDPNDPAAGFPEHAAMAQVYWESEGGDWTAVGEYEWDSSVPEDKGHYAGVAFQAPKFGRGGWRPRLRWLHAFPIVYGKPGSYYRALEGDETDLPVEDVVSVLLRVELKLSF